MNTMPQRALPEEKMPDMAIAMLAGGELQQAIRLVQSLLDDPAAFGELDVLSQLRDGDHGTPYKAIALYLNRCARSLQEHDSPAFHAPVVRALKHLRERLVAAAEADAPALDGPASDGGDAAAPANLTLEDGIRLVYETTVWRTPGASEIATWKQNLANGLPFHEFLLLMSRSAEANQPGIAIGLHNGSDGRFVQLAHEHTQNRGAGPAEVNHWLFQLENGNLSRSAVLSQLFMAGVKWREAMDKAAPHDGLSCRIMGTNRDLTATQWTRQADELAQQAGDQPSAATPPDGHRDARYRNRFRISGSPRVLVSAITSLYRGGAFIEQFMDNITSQEGFRDYCELVIVDADSPEGEYETIKRYLADFPNINYIRINHRIGIYDAWNVAAQAARGEYLTNANLDDLRRADSFMLQAATLDTLSFVDIAYQDLYYTFDPRLSFEEIARFGHQTALPVITLHNMVQHNSPHNAPMWRKSLHDELGYFDINYKSAGDYEFWFRCLAAGKVFYKINDPHVAYYQNPKGLSTRPDSRGLMEALDVHKRYCRKLMPEEVVMPSETFLRALRPAGGGSMPRNRYRYGMAQDALRAIARTRKVAEAGA
jgi:glycosyltransferase involved in cell wall biosynthesis